MKSLQEIKNNYAQEYGYEEWDSLWHAHIHKLLDFEIIMDDICLIAQKAALENAAENVTTVHHANQSSYEIERAVHYTKHSITNKNNLIR